MVRKTFNSPSFAPIYLFFSFLFSFFSTATHQYYLLCWYLPYATVTTLCLIRWNKVWISLLQTGKRKRVIWNSSYGFVSYSSNSEKEQVQKIWYSMCIYNCLHTFDINELTPDAPELLVRIKIKFKKNTFCRKFRRNSVKIFNVLCKIPY